MVKTAIVILNYNGKHFLKKFLPAVIEKSKGASIIVSDNKSTDDSVVFIKKNFPSVVLIELEQNYGYAGGYNQTLKQINSDFYVLLNSDIEVTDGWLDPMTKFMEANEEYASCQPKIKNYQSKDRFEYAGACGGFLDNMGYPFCRGRIFDHTEVDHGQYDASIDIFWSSGACMMVRAKDFHKAGAFDESFFAHMEEIDLCWRLRSLGKKIRVITESTVFHVGGGTLSYKNPFKTYLNFRNGLKLLIKNLPLAQLMIKLPLRLLLDWVALFVFAIQGNGKHSISVMKSHLYMLKNFYSTYKKRTLTSPIENKKSILWTYFVKGSKNYSDQ